MVLGGNCSGNIHWGFLKLNIEFWDKKLKLVLMLVKFEKCTKKYYNKAFYNYFDISGNRTLDF